MARKMAVRWQGGDFISRLFEPFDPITVRVFTVVGAMKRWIEY